MSAVIALGLTPQERVIWRTRGWLVRRGVYEAHEVARMRGAFQRMADVADGLGPGPRKRAVGNAQMVTEPMEGDRQRIHRVVWAGALEPVLDRLGQDRRLTEVAGELLRSSRLDQLVCQAHYKRPGDGVAFPMHQDSANRRHGTPLWLDGIGDGAYVQTLTAIDPMAESNGALQLVPGSHRCGHLGLHRSLTPEMWGGRAPVLLRLEPGDVVWWGSFVVHGSAANRSSRARRAFVNGFARPGVNRRAYPGAGLGRPVSIR